MTTSILLSRIRQENPKVQIRDIWRIIEQLRSRGLAQYLHRDSVIGSIVYWTQLGAVYRDIVHNPVPFDSPDSWELYGYVMRGKTRRAIVWRFFVEESLYSRAYAASTIRKRLLAEYPLCLNAVIRAIHELVACGVLIATGTGSKSTQLTYELTVDGKKIGQLLDHIFSKESCSKFI